MKSCNPSNPSSGSGANTPCDSTRQTCPANPSSSGTPIKILEGEIVELSWKSGISAAYNKRQISAPHWEQGVNVDDGAGSNRAAVYLFDTTGSSTDVEIKVNITRSQNVSGNGRLFATFGGLEIEGSCPTSVGTHTVSAQIKRLPDKITWIKGNINWQLESASYGSTVSLSNNTRAEIFVIFNHPATFYTNGVWVEALRFLCDNVSLTGETDETSVAAKITRYLHGSHGLTYDTVRGASRYFKGSSFNLKNYLIPLQPTVNCHDQAAAIQVLMGSLGLTTDYIFLGGTQTNPSPIFGFIHTTDLIGVGLCNNPFFTNSSYTNSKIVPINDPGRSNFFNHGFIKFNGKILDACAEPHTGNESPTQYLNASIDYAETTRRGKVGARASNMTSFGVPINSVK